MKTTHLLAFAFVGAAMLIGSQNLFTNIVQPPAGFTGAPGELTCASAGCHAGTATALTFTNELATGVRLASPSSTNDIRNGLIPNNAYNLFVSAGQAADHGFSLTAQNAAGDSVGNFTLTSPSLTSLQVANGRQYVGHKDASGTNGWAFRWSSPADVSEPVFFYLAVNQANGDNLNSGDQIYRAAYRADTDTMVLVSPSVGIQSIDALTDGSIAVFPNPVSDRLSLSFNLATGTAVNAAIYNMAGQLVKPLIDEELSWGTHDRSYNVAGELSTGIYLVKMTVNGANYFKKIVVE